jgi:hypothetical protein
VISSFSIGPHPNLARGHADRNSRAVQRRGNLTHYCRSSRIFDVEDQNAGMYMRTGVQAKARVGPARFAESATAGTIGSIADVQKIFLDRGCRVHAAIEQSILTNDLKVCGVLRYRGPRK